MVSTSSCWWWNGGDDDFLSDSSSMKMSCELNKHGNQGFGAGLLGGEPKWAQPCHQSSQWPSTGSLYPVQLQEGIDCLQIDHELGRHATTMSTMIMTVWNLAVTVKFCMTWCRPCRGMGTIQPLSLSPMSPTEGPIGIAAHAIPSTGTEEHVTVSHLSLFHSWIESTVGCRFKNVMGTYLRRKRR